MHPVAGVESGAPGALGHWQRGVAGCAELDEIVLERVEPRRIGRHEHEFHETPVSSSGRAAGSYEAGVESDGSALVPGAASPRRTR